MRTPVRCVWLLFASALSALWGIAAQGAQTVPVQTGTMSTVRLLATARLTQPAPDGMRFLFMVWAAPGSPGKFTLKETRDFLVDGKSYREMTKAQTGREWEPSTEFNTAEGFFAKQPGARRLAPKDITGAKILVIQIGGATLPAQGTGEITLHVGFEKQIEPFTFSFPVPPGRAAKSPARPAAAMSGPPPAPPADATRYVATEGVGFAPWTFDLKLGSGTVSGAVYQHRHDVSGVITIAVGPFEIFHGRSDGQKVTFKARSATGDRVATFTGELAGDDIRFTRTLDLSPGASAGLNGILGAAGATKFVARKAAP